jgi:hypothetical protein
LKLSKESPKLPNRLLPKSLSLPRIIYNRETPKQPTLQEPTPPNNKKTMNESQLQPTRIVQEQILQHVWYHPIIKWSRCVYSPRRMTQTSPSHLEHHPAIEFFTLATLYVDVVGKFKPTNQSTKSNDPPKAEGTRKSCHPPTHPTNTLTPTNQRTYQSFLP